MLTKSRLTTHWKEENQRYTLMCKSAKLIKKNSQEKTIFYIDLNSEEIFRHCEFDPRPDPTYFLSNGWNISSARIFKALFVSIFIIICKNV